MKHKIKFYGILAALGLLFLIGRASTLDAAPSGNINGYQSVCDPNSPTHCEAPDGAGRLPDFGATTNDWSFASAASGISNTNTAVTIRAAQTGLRNYVTSCQVEANTLGGATELAIRDGAAGTVIWRTQLQTTGIPAGLMVSFPSPLRSTAGNLLEVVTLTAVTGNVYVNCQGYSGP